MMKRFCTDYRGKRPDLYSNYGKLWTVPEKEQLQKLFLSGQGLGSICGTLGRPPAGVIPKLEALSLICLSVVGNYCWTDFAKSLNNLKEPKMNPDAVKNTPTQDLPHIETKVFIRGCDASTMSDMEIFEVIRDLEKSVENLKGISNRPKKLKALIDQYEADIVAIVAYIDGRP